MKKFFCILFLAVTAMAFVSCSDSSDLEDEVTKAADANDLTRLIAIGDSIKALGDNADGATQAIGVFSYIIAFSDFSMVVESDSIDGSKYKGFDVLDKDMDKLAAFCDNIQALYKSAIAKDPEGCKEIFDEFKNETGGVGIEVILAQVKEQRKEAMELKEQWAEENAHADEEDAAIEEAENEE